MKLHHLNLELLVDAAYRCGQVHEKVNLYIAAPSGTGKTIATRTLREAKGVSYLFGKFTPSEYVKALDKARNKSLLIHDDIGRIEKRYFQDLVAVWGMMGDEDGVVQVKDFGKDLVAWCPYPVILISTLEQQHKWFSIFSDSGLYDRFLPIKLQISPQTLAKHLKYLQDFADALDKKWEDAQAWHLDASWCDEEDVNREYPKRDPKELARHKAMDITPLSLSSRHSRSLLALSRYLSPEAMGELIQIVRSPSPVYEI